MSCRGAAVLVGALVLAASSTSDSWAATGDWQLPAQSLQSAPEGVGSPEVAVAPDGTATAVWPGIVNPNSLIQVATRPAGSSSFGSPQNLSLPGQDADYPQVAVAPDGTTTVVWRRYNGANYIIQAATRPAGSNSFGTTQNLSESLQNANAPQVAVAPDGTATVVWSRSNGTNQVVQAATRAPGSVNFGTAQNVSETGQNASLPQVAVADDGATTVVWKRSNGSFQIIQAALRAAGSNSFGVPQNLSATGANADMPQVAAGPGSSATVAWARYSGANQIIQAASRAAGSNSFEAAQDLTATGRDATMPQVAVAPDGAATVAWVRSNGTDYIVQAATRAAGSNSFGSTQDLSAVGRNGSGPQVAVAPDGAATVVWSSSLNFTWVIQAATRSAGSGTFGAPQNLSADGSLMAAYPEVAIGANGAATSVWQRDQDPPLFGHIQAVGSTATSYPVDVQAVGPGSVSSTPAGISCGSVCSLASTLSSSITLTATPDDGANFSGWGGACSGSSPTCTLTVLGARSVTAEFTTKPTPGPAPGPGPSPAPSPSIKALGSKVTGREIVITSRVTVPGAGRVTQRATEGKRTWCRAARSTTAATSVTLTCRIGKKGRSVLRKKALRLSVGTTFTPTVGAAVTSDRKLTIKRKR